MMEYKDKINTSFHPMSRTWVDTVEEEVQKTRLTLFFTPHWELELIGLVMEYNDMINAIFIPCWELKWIGLMMEYINMIDTISHPPVFENREKMVLVMEYAAGGELYDYLSERKVLSEDEARRVFRHVASATYYCHKVGCGVVSTSRSYTSKTSMYTSP